MISPRHQNIARGRLNDPLRYTADQRVGDPRPPMRPDGEEVRSAPNGLREDSGAGVAVDDYALPSGPEITKGSLQPREAGDSQLPVLLSDVSWRYAQASERRVVRMDHGTARRFGVDDAQGYGDH